MFVEIFDKKNVCLHAVENIVPKIAKFCILPILVNNVFLLILFIFAGRLFLFGLKINFDSFCFSIHFVNFQEIYFGKRSHGARAAYLLQSRDICDFARHSAGTMGRRQEIHRIEYRRIAQLS